METTTRSGVKLIIAFLFASLTALIASPGNAQSPSATQQQQSTPRFAFAQSNDNGQLVITIATAPADVTAESSDAPESDDELREEQYDVSVPVTKSVTQSYVVSVPYTESVIQNGKEVEVLKLRQETRTRTVPVTTYRKEKRVRMVRGGKSNAAEPRPVTYAIDPDGVQYFTVSGTAVEPAKAIESLAKKRPVLLIDSAPESIGHLLPFLKDDLLVLRRAP